jgi:erythromycin esterase-like protein
VEGDWPDCQHVDRFVKARPGTAARAGEALAHFQRWPVLHDAGCGDALLLWDGNETWARQELLHRAIGVVYRPEEERWGNYVPTVLARRYDAFCHLDRTGALHPLDGQRVGGQESPPRMQEAT